ncbi:MAG: LamG domain-containing protein [Planctomycetes bacterium]|nr:LamG domain-containing protein [Planctomycetota bacterium]
MAAWIKPAADLGRDMHPGGGDIIGYRHRRFILKLLGGDDTGTKAPCRLAARLNVHDGIVTDRIVEGNRWQHVALTADPENGQRRMRLFLDGNQVAEGLTTKWSE